LVGEAGSLRVFDRDEVTRKLATLIEGEWEGLGPVQAAKKFGYTRQRYFQLRAAFLLAHKVSGHLVGVWLLVAEHLRLGTWDLLRAWTGQPTERAEPRLAMQLVHEAALCTTGIRSDRNLTTGGFRAGGRPPLRRQ